METAVIFQSNTAKLAIWGPFDSATMAATFIGEAVGAANTDWLIAPMNRPENWNAPMAEEHHEATPEPDLYPYRPMSPDEAHYPPEHIDATVPTMVS
jgi:hypothetical protein